MLKKTLLLLIIAPFFVVCTAEALQVTDSPLVTAQKTPHRGYNLSVNAVRVPFESLLRELAVQCPVSIASRGEDHLLPSISIRFKDLPLEQAIKKLLKAGGIHNYLIRYSDRGNGQPLITEVIIFDGSGKSDTSAGTAQSPSGPEHEEPEAHPKPSPAAQDAFSEKLASFKERYVWESDEMRNRALYLIQTMPDESQGPGLEGIMKELDRNSAERREAVDEELFYRAIEAAAPPGLAPFMMRQVRRLSEHYHDSGTARKSEMPVMNSQDFAAEGRR